MGLIIESGITISGAGGFGLYVPPPPSYAISANLASVNEGSSIIFTVTTERVADGTTLYWTNLGNTVAADFTDNTTSGSFVINGNTGTVTRTLTNDATTEGAESIVLQVRTDSTLGTVVATAGSVSVGDTSLNPSPTYAVEYVIVGGGGAGKQEGLRYPGPAGGPTYPGAGGGGGGGGGVVTGSFTATRSSAYTLTVGAGASVTGGTSSTPAANGSSSSISGTGISQTVSGGGGGAGNKLYPGGATSGQGNNGGAAGNYPNGGGNGGPGGPLSTTGVNWVSNGGGGGGGGGAGPASNGGAGGGEGGSLTAGGLSTTKGQFGGTGGNGLTVSIYGTPTTYGGGGAGGATFTEKYAPFAPYNASVGTGMQVVPTSGGSGGGGNSFYGRGWVISNSNYSVAPNGVPYAQNWTPGTAGGANTGGGGAGGGMVLNFCTNATTGSGTTQHASIDPAAGGSGVVILSMPTAQYPGSASGATVSTPPAAPGMTVLTYNSSGTYTA